jgi:two-component system, OmpR family, response regulator PhoP
MNIYLVDDDEASEELVQSLAHEGFQVSGFSDAASFYEAFVRLPCDIAVINATLADSSALSIAATLRHCVNTRIAVISAADSAEARLRSFESGADVTLVKPICVRELAAQLRAIYRRLLTTQNVAASQTQKSWTLKEGGWVFCDPAGHALRLTTAERALLLCLLQMRGSPVSRDALISTLGGNPRFADPHRIDVLINRLRQKARTVSMGLPLHSVRSKGYMLAVDASLVSQEDPLFLREDSNGSYAPQINPQVHPKGG